MRTSSCPLALGLAVTLLACTAGASARPAATRAVAIARRAIAFPGASLPANISVVRSPRFMMQKESWMRISVTRDRARTHNRLWVYSDEGGPVFSASDPTLVEYRGGTVVAHPFAGHPGEVARSERRGSTIVTTIRGVHPSGLQSITTAVYEPRSGAATIDEQARMSGATVPVRSTRATLERGLRPGLDLYLQITDPSTRPARAD